MLAAKWEPSGRFQPWVPSRAQPTSLPHRILPAMPAPTCPTALLRSPRFLDHDTGDHVENANRLPAIDAELERQDLISGRPDVPFGPADLADVERVHNPWYVQAIDR